MARRYLKDFDKGAHSVYLLYYHLVVVVKYRRKVITDEYAEVIKDTLFNIGERFNVGLVEFNGESDHIHALLNATPSTNMSQFIGQFKGRSSHDLLKQFPEIKDKIGRDGVFWSPSYCLLTTGGAPIDVIKQYITSQAGFDPNDNFEDVLGEQKS